MPSREPRARLILDLGNVLVEHDDDLLASRLSRLLGDGDPRTLLTAFRQSGVEAGRRPVEDVYLALARRLGAFADLAAFRDIWSSHFTPKPEMLAFAADWARAAPLVICSNTNALHWSFVCEHFQVDRLGPAVLSHECGFEKPDSEIYLLAAEAHGVAPQDCLFVDDKPANIEGARAVGMRTHLFRGLDGLTAALNTGA